MEYSSNYSLFAGEGEVRSLLRRHDWSTFPGGEPERWPAAVTGILWMLLNSNAPMCFLWRPELTYFYNDAYVQLIGAKHPGALVRPFWESWEETRESFAPILELALGGEFCSMENMAFSILRNGALEKVYFTYSLLPVFDASGSVIGVLNSGVETTGHVMFNRRQEFQLRLADRIRPLTDPDEVIASACEMLGRYLGVTRVVYGEVAGHGETISMKRDWSDGELPSMSGAILRLDDFGPVLAGAIRAGAWLAVPDVTSDARSAAYASVYAANGVRSFMGIPLMKSGALRAIVNIHDANCHDWTADEIAVAQDMVDRTWSAAEHARSQTELRAERDQSKYIFDSMAEGFAVLDSDWTVLRVNGEGLRITQRTAPGVLEKNHWDIWPELKGTGLEAVYRQVKETRKAEIVEMPYAFPDGKQGWIEVRAHPALDDCLAFFFRDITERKAYQERLKDADRRKDEFLAMLAHELRNPLAPIGAAATLLQRVKLDDEHVRRTSQVIDRQVRHMTSLIDDLLDVSRVTRGLVELDNASLDMRDVVSDAVEQVMPLIQSRRQVLDLHLAEHAITVTGDRKRLVQVIVNILNNAAKYTPEDGTISLAADVRDAQVLVDISDNGIGMAPELVSRAFDLFSQAERTSDRAPGGLGLGLALVKHLVELHHGSVECESRGVGKGSRFTIRLPRELVARQEREPQASDDVQAVSQRVKVLLVDDNADAAAMLAMLLEAAGHEVIVEHGSLAALERASKEAPQVCLLDIGLPDIDGNALARRLRAAPETADAMLIAVTGYGQEKDREDSMAAGFDHYFVKPIDTKELVSLLSGAVGRSRAS